MDAESRVCVFFTTVTFLSTLLSQQREQLLEVRHSGAAVLQEAQEEEVLEKELLPRALVLCRFTAPF